ncbi:MAG: hypothetical protein ACOX60_01060 [Massiliimalia sp.]
MRKDKFAVNQDGDGYLDQKDVVSSTECTGLIPTPPVSQAEAEAYASLYSVPKPQKTSSESVKSKKAHK